MSALISMGLFWLKAAGLVRVMLWVTFSPFIWLAFSPFQAVQYLTLLAFLGFPAL